MCIQINTKYRIFAFVHLNSFVILSQTPMKSRFHNSTVIITGAASGMGHELALQAASKGARVIATDVNETGLAETAALAAKQGFMLETHRLNVANIDEITTFAANILPTLTNTRLILINNAGVAIVGGAFWEVSADDAEWLLNINLWGVLRMTRAFLPFMLAENDGHIVNISSVFGLAGMARHSAYSTAKFAVRGFTESLRMELLGKNIETTCVHPGGIKTSIYEHSRRTNHLDSPAMRDIGNKEFLQSARTTAAEAARQILSAVEHRKRRLLIGADARFIDLITRLAPVRYSRILSIITNRLFRDSVIKLSS
jgi:NAD(P)-dependent dehydrogenase (short-subunit alcohol dehydrogenase family)